MTGLHARIVPPSEYDGNLLAALRTAEKRIGELEAERDAAWKRPPWTTEYQEVFDAMATRLASLQAALDEARQTGNDLLDWLCRVAEKEEWGWNTFTTPDVFIAHAAALAASELKDDASHV